jgi:hypothetical protein
VEQAKIADTTVATPISITARVMMLLLRRRPTVALISNVLGANGSLIESTPLPTPKTHVAHVGGFAQ